MTRIAPVEWWNSFWFARNSPAPICVLRIMCGILALAGAFRWAPNLFAFFGSDGIASEAAIKAYEEYPRFSLLFFLPQTDSAVVLVYALLIVSALCVIVGFRTRLSCFALFASLLSFHHRDPAIICAADRLLRTLVFLLVFSPAGAMFSMDRLLSKHNKNSASQWQISTSIVATRLIQLQIASVYFQAFWAKLSDPLWRGGLAVYYITRQDCFAGLHVPYVFDHLWSCRMLSWGTLLIEFSLWTLIWWRKSRLPVLSVAVLFHLGIAISMNIPLFEFLMISSFVVFVEPHDLKRTLDWMRGSLPEKTVVAARRSADRLPV